LYITNPSSNNIIAFQISNYKKQISNLKQQIPKHKKQKHKKKITKTKLIVSWHQRVNPIAAPATQAPLFHPASRSNKQYCHKPHQPHKRIPATVITGCHQQCHAVNRAASANGNQFIFFFRVLTCCCRLFTSDASCPTSHRCWALALAITNCASQTSSTSSALTW
jgi:hypothetical protein